MRISDWSSDLCSSVRSVPWPAVSVTSPAPCAAPCRLATATSPSTTKAPVFTRLASTIQSVERTDATAVALRTSKYCHGVRPDRVTRRIPEIRSRSPVPPGSATKVAIDRVLSGPTVRVDPSAHRISAFDSAPVTSPSLSCTTVPGAAASRSAAQQGPAADHPAGIAYHSSEERRVGNEGDMSCGFWWCAYYHKKKG